MRHFLLLICLLLGLAVHAAPPAPAPPAGVSFYVAPAGQDAWSGGLPAANKARTDGPFASLQRARDAVRALKRKGPLASPVTITLRGGLYCLPETLVLGPEDSGTETCPITYRSYPGETAVLSGGRVLGNWREVRSAKPGRWMTHLGEVEAGQWDFQQLYAQRKGEPWFTRRFRPTRGMLAIADTTYSPARKTAAHRAAQQDFVFFPGDLQPWENLGDVELVALHSWSASRLRIEKLDMERRVCRLTSVPTFRIGHWYADERNPYFVENVKADLQQPGQWYLDRPTGTLTYLPLPGETLQNTTLVAPRLAQIVSVRGDLNGPAFVEHVTFQGLGFAHSSWLVPAQGYDTSQGQPALPAGVEVSAGHAVRFERCTVANTGAYGIGLGKGSQECGVVGCLMYDLGGGGVKVGEQSLNRKAVYPELPTGNVVENNTITHTGICHYSANGIWCGVVRGTRIRHNTVSYNPYTGIAVGWCWDPQPSSCGDNLIEANHVHHIMQLVQDGGGIYTLGRQPGTVIRGNLIHDSNPSPFACGPGTVGLYFDEGSSGFLVEDNIQYDIAYHPERINQNQNTAAEHDIRTNYLGIKPDEKGFPKALAAQAGVEAGYRWPLAGRLQFTPEPVYGMQLTTYPTRPVSFALDFEDVPVGMCPRHFSGAGTTAQATIGVTDETAAGGSRCLKFQDRAGLPKIFYPYLNRTGWHVTQGPVEMSFDLKRDATSPGRLWCELRDYDTKDQGEFWAGPSLGFLPDGQIMVGKTALTTVPPGQWCHVVIRFTLGADQPREWQVAVTLPDGTVAQATNPYSNPKFSILTALIMSADQDAAGAVYVDNLALTVPE